MNFSEDRPIAKQVEEYCYMMVTSGQWPEESHIPSTKDLAASLGVNPRTVMKAYDSLAADGIIYQRKGLGYFISPDANSQVLAARRLYFLQRKVAALGAEMRSLGLTASDLLPYLEATSDD